MQDRFKFRYVFKNKIYDVDTLYLEIPAVSLVDTDRIGEKYLLHTSKRDFDFKNLIQCTGLKDKSGKLIFEGDIVKINENYPDYSAIGDFYKNQSFVVEYFQSNARYLLKPSEYEDNSGSGIYDLSPDFYEFLNWKPTGKFEENTLQGIEIIGNVYENPELLEESQC
jgi:uncharacterized phage protein (TIGR01671 family)